ncbi:hypothetical protein LMH87_006939 [Akanthomyces muscarius]|uniref:BZIP domain-containing protein n=1 Tax=Akanthomyces muscarius TaxID=2231603 RepID=A0A9W8QS46_AKAMU|nr:hypothetical protein LMH87_006939 [Akanthomyces muscarius]KAJ4165302.1 hypothetical protein LMH87_006939 [Akanthomyces muscarius]
MAPRAGSSANHNTTALHLPIATPLQPTTTTATTTNDFSSPSTNKRPLTVEDDGEFFENGQRASPSERGFPIEAQIHHDSYGQPQQQDQDWSLIDFQLGAQQLQEIQSFDSQYDNFQDGTGPLPFDPSAVHDLLPPREELQEGQQFDLGLLSTFIQHHQQQQQELAPVSQTLQYDPDTAFYGVHLPTSPSVAHHQSVLQQPAQQLFPTPPPPPPPRPLTTVTPPQPRQQLSPVRQSVYTNRHCSWPVMASTAAATTASVPVVTSFAAAAAASSSSAYPLRQQHPPPPAPAPSLNSMRVGGFALEEAGIKLPEDLGPEERQRRLCLLAQELHYEALHPPILPSSQVPDLPEKPPPMLLPSLNPGMSPEERQFVTSEIRRVGAAQKALDKERNNMAAKKSRMLRLESLENTRLQLNAKAAECAWLRLQMVALSGHALGRNPSEAWGGFDYVYRRRKRKRNAPPTTRDEQGREVQLVLGNEVVEDAVGEGEEEEEEEEVEDAEVYAESGVVPRRIKLGITEEVRARVEAHKMGFEEVQKRKTSESRTARTATKAAREQAQALLDADVERRQPRRGSRGSRR